MNAEMFDEVFKKTYNILHIGLILADAGYGYYNQEGSIEESCPHCENKVELLSKFEKQKCPSCGEWIVPCCMCNTDLCNCSQCPLEGIA